MDKHEDRGTQALQISTEYTDTTSYRVGSNTYGTGKLRVGLGSKEYSPVTWNAIKEKHLMSIQFPNIDNWDKAKEISRASKMLSIQVLLKESY